MRSVIRESLIECEDRVEIEEIQIDRPDTFGFKFTVDSGKCIKVRFEHDGLRLLSDHPFTIQLLTETVISVG